MRRRAGAQRLTASQQRAPTFARVIVAASGVLNASRHHSNEHLHAITPKIAAT